MSKKDMPAPASSEPSPEPAQAQASQPSEPQPTTEMDLSRGLAEMAKLTSSRGHKLLGHLTSLEGLDPDLARAAHDIAFVVNTDLAGKIAPEGLAKLSSADLASLLQRVASESPSIEELAQQIRDRFPEPKRNQPQI
jgi:hypothetical protein